MRRESHEERIQRDMQKCKHFNGCQNKTCNAGVSYDAMFYKGLQFGDEHKSTHWIPCYPQGENDTRPIHPCDLKELTTREEAEARWARIKRSSELIAQGLSACCEAPLNESQVIREGRHKGHGPRFCSKCGRLAFMV